MIMKNEMFLLGMKIFDLPFEQTQTKTQETEKIEPIESSLLRRSILTFLQFRMETG